MAYKEVPFLGVKAKKAKPTKQHRPAIWECMLGTVYARSPKGEVKYCDYRYDEAIAFAELGEDTRVYKAEETLRYGWGSDSHTIRKGRIVLWTNERVKDPNGLGTIIDKRV